MGIKWFSLVLEKSRQWLIRLLGGQPNTNPTQQIPPKAPEKNPETPIHIPAKTPTMDKDSIGMGSTDKPVYRIRRSLLTVPETAFFGALTKELGQEFILFAKVRLGDICFLANEPVNRGLYSKPLWGKHFDFLICDTQYSPLLVIELDDSSHKKFDSQESDKFKDTLCMNAGLKLLRVCVSASYHGERIREWIDFALKSSESVSYVDTNGRVRESSISKKISDNEAIYSSPNS